MGEKIIEEENESWAQSKKKLQKIIKDQLQFERDIELQRAHCSGKTKIDRASNKVKLSFKLYGYTGRFIRV